MVKTVPPHASVDKGDVEKSPDPFDSDVKWIQRSAWDDEQLLSRLSWGELRTFLTVAKLGSMNRAANYLSMTQRSVSQHVLHLQSMVGAQIVVHGRSGTRLTDVGRDLAALLLRFDRDLHFLAADLAAAGDGMVAGSVRITISDGLGLVFAAPAIGQFSEQHPRIAVHLKTPLNYRNLADNQTDMMIGFAPDPDPDVTSRRLGTIHLLPIAGKSYIARCGVPNVQNLSEHAFIDSDQYSSRSGIFDPWHRLRDGGQVRLHCDTSFTYATLVRLGKGIGLLGNYTMMDPEFVPLDLGVHIRLPLYAIALTERLKAKPVRLTFDLMARLFGKANPWFGDRLFLSTEPLEKAGIVASRFSFPHL